jgi:hypothetical protein
MQINLTKIKYICINYFIKSSFYSLFQGLLLDPIELAKYRRTLIEVPKIV